MYPSYDEYLRITEDPFITDDEPTARPERCPYCGDSCPADRFGTWNGNRMCLDCVAAEELEARRDAMAQQQFSLCYDELVESITYQVSRCTTKDETSPKVTSPKVTSPKAPPHKGGEQAVKSITQRFTCSTRPLS